MVSPIQARDKPACAASAAARGRVCSV